MTEKQYRLNKWGTRLLKNNRPLFDWTNESDEIVDLLNQLNDENEQLKARVDYLERKIQRWLKRNEEEYVEEDIGYYMTKGRGF